MSRPTTLSSEEILEAARQVFLRKGHAAPTAEIARRAGVSEGTLFKRWGTKDKLFLAAMAPESPTWADKVEAMVGQGEVRENLVAIAGQILAFYQQATPRIIHIWASSLHRKRRKLGPNSPPVVGIQLTTDYLAAEAALGRLAVADPEVAARVFLGALHKFAFQELLGVNVVLPMEVDRFIRGLVDLLWAGLAPR
jgi:AcrR family transcriptional regulator